jgi:preprotein translocase subunit SecF
MEFFTHKTKIDFMAQKKWAFLFSIAILLFSIGSVVIKGMNFGLDFTGGIQLELGYEAPPNLNQVRDRLAGIGLDPIVQSYGSSKGVLIKLKIDKELTQQQLTDKVLNVLEGANLHRVEMIGAQVGEALVTDGILAILIALLGTMIYIAFRFEYRFALSAVISLIHDPLLITGIFSFFQIEFDLIALAALLTVIGYSLNDTIVVYDRVRENFRKVRKATTEEILNLSINQTLSRTIMISGLTFSIVTALLIFGGQMLRGFSIAMMVGIAVGTYSSIYIAGSLALLFGLDRKHLVKTEKKIVDSMP